MYKLLDWIDINKLNSYYLSANPNAIHILEQNIDKIEWGFLSNNPNAIHLLEKNIDKINWYLLSRNPNAIHLLEKNIDKINWHYLSENPSIFNYDYDSLRERCHIYMEELIQKTMHPNIIQKYLNLELDLDDF